MVILFNLVTHTFFLGRFSFLYQNFIVSHHHTSQTFCYTFDSQQNSEIFQVANHLLQTQFFILVYRYHFALSLSPLGDLYDLVELYMPSYSGQTGDFNKDFLSKY